MLRVAGCELRVTGCGLRVAGYGLRVAGLLNRGERGARREKKPLWVWGVCCPLQLGRQSLKWWCDLKGENEMKTFAVVRRKSCFLTV